MSDLLDSLGHFKEALTKKKADSKPWFEEQQGAHEYALSVVRVAKGIQGKIKGSTLFFLEMSRLDRPLMGSGL